MNYQSVEYFYNISTKDINFWTHLIFNVLHASMFNVNYKINVNEQILLSKDWNFW